MFKFVSLVLVVCVFLLVSSQVALAASSISGTVWLDKNQNGVHDGNEAGLPHIPVYLRNGLNEIVAARLTDTGGTYSFADVDPGNYTLLIVNPAAGYLYTNAGADMDVNTTTGQSAVLVVGTGTNLIVDAGLRRIGRTLVRCDSASFTDEEIPPFPEFAIQKFTKANSTLTGVTVNLSAAISHSGSVTNNAGQAGNIEIFFNDELGVTLPDNTELAYEPDPPPTWNFGMVDSDETKEFVTPIVAGQVSTTYSGPLADFQGTGDTVFPSHVASNFVGLFNGSGTLKLAIYAGYDAQMTLCVTYAFDIPALIRGRVFDDKNKNSIFDNSDTNLAREVCLYFFPSNALKECRLSKTNNKPINYKFPNLPPDTYYVRVNPLPNYECFNPASCQGSNLTVGPNDKARQDFALVAIAPPPTVTPTPLHLKEIVFDDGTDQLFVADRDANRVNVYNANTLAAQSGIPVGTQPFGMATLNGLVYAANYDSNSISVINASTQTVVKTIALGDCGNQPSHLAVNPLTNKLYVTMHDIGRVAVINTSTNAYSHCVYGVNGGAFGIAVNPTLNRIYVTGRDSFDVRVIDGATDTLLTDPQIEFDGSPYQVAADPNTNRIYVAVSTPDDDFEVVTNLYVYTVTADTITPVAGSPFPISNNHDGGGIAASPCSGKIYIAESANNTVRVLNSNLTVNTVLNQGAGADPYGLTFGNGKVYITNRGISTISAIADCP